MKSFLVFFGISFFILCPGLFPQDEQGRPQAPDSESINDEPGLVGQEIPVEELPDSISAPDENQTGESEEGEPEENSADPEAVQNPGAAPQTEAAAAPPVQLSPANERRMNILRYGTDTEIASLIQTLRTEKDPSLDNALTQLAVDSKNKIILTGILTFFGEREKTGIEDVAVRIIGERDFEANETVQAAVDYLGRVNAAVGVEVLRELIDSGEIRFLNNAIRSFGRAAKGHEAADGAAQFLLDYYSGGNPNSENQREIIVAVGETGSSTGIPFLSDMIRNIDERAVLKMAALDALGKIGDPAGLDAVIEAVSATDPNVRASAIGALGPFSGEAADRAILEGFRDSFYRTRIGAAQAAARRKMEDAVPYLKFRAENDDVPTAKDEAIKALGAIWSRDAITVLESLFFDRKLSDRVRVLSGEMLLRNDSAAYSGRAIVELEDAKSQNQSVLYNGILRILGPGMSPSLESLAKRFLVSGTIVEKSLALDMVVNNNFLSLEEDVRSCLDEKRNGAGLSRKAQIALEKLGLN